jgi:hypothetical protein
MDPSIDYADEWILTKVAGSLKSHGRHAISHTPAATAGTKSPTVVFDKDNANLFE